MTLLTFFGGVVGLLVTGIIVAPALVIVMVSGVVPLPVLGVIPSIVVFSFVLVYVYGVVSGYIYHFIFWLVSAVFSGTGTNRTIRRALMWVVSLLYLILTGVALILFIPALVASYAAVVLATGTAIAYALLQLMVLFAIPHFILVVLLYVIADGLSLPAGSPGSTTGGEAFTRGLMIGLNAVMNFLFGTAIAGVVFEVFGPFGMPGAFAVGTALGLIGFVGAFMPVADGFGRFVMGWASWLLPMSWCIVFFGWVLFLFNVLGNVVFFSLGVFGMDVGEVDVGTGTMHTQGGIASNFRFQNFTAVGTGTNAYNMGVFAFRHADTSAGAFAPLGSPMAFGEPLTGHESGHNLSLSATGSWLHWINAIDENVFAVSAAGLGGPNRVSGAYAERLAESNRQVVNNWIPAWRP